MRTVERDQRVDRRAARPGHHPALLVLLPLAGSALLRRQRPAQRLADKAVVAPDLAEAAHRLEQARRGLQRRVAVRLAVLVGIVQPPPRIGGLALADLEFGDDEDAAVR